MKISEVIKELEEMKQKYGDIKVRAYDRTSTDGDVEHIVYSEVYNSVLIDMWYEDDDGACYETFHD